ncbi:MAG TPA: transcriptional regulator [Acidilobales archaeon]|nr:transcriptional regulator [Acidilobales archaeon]
MEERTIRERIIELLISTKEPLDVRDIATYLGLDLREADIIYDHLRHAAKTIRRLSEGRLQLVMQPPYCLNCGYVFKDLDRPRKPSKCPKCKSQRIAPPRFKIIEV